MFQKYRFFGETGDSKFQGGKLLTNLLGETKKLVYI